MTPTHQPIATRVCIDDILGPFDCVLDPAVLWHGGLSPHFAQDVVRELSAQTLRVADAYGHNRYDTIHIVEGRADSQDTVHLIEGGPAHRDAKGGGRQAVAVHVPWRRLGKGAHASVTDATAQARKAARKRKVTGRGASSVVVVHVRWSYLHEGVDTAATIICPDAEGRYAIGGWEWIWHFATWWCACRKECKWHELQCTCGLTRDGQPKTPLAAAGDKAGQILRQLVPGATSALVDLTDLPRVCAVFAGDSEIDTANDTGPFDTETLGQADEALRAAMDEAVPGDFDTSGWEPVPDKDSNAVYRITFPAVSTP